MPVFRLSPVKNTKNKYVEQAVQLIREHFREDINISTVAGELEISEGYLSRVFKKETDYTFTSYLTRYRMKKAMTLLKDCRVKVYEVAEQVGYSDTAYFSAQFKKADQESLRLNTRTAAGKPEAQLQRDNAGNSAYKEIQKN